MCSRESDAWARFASPTLLLLPQMRKLRGDDALVGNVTGEYADVARELVHAGDETPRDRCVVIGKISANELGDQLGLGRRKKLAAHLGRACDILLQRGLRLHHGADN